MPDAARQPAAQAGAARPAPPAVQPAGGAQRRRLVERRTLKAAAAPVASLADFVPAPARATVALPAGMRPVHRRQGFPMQSALLLPGCPPVLPALDSEYQPQPCPALPAIT